MPEVYIDENGKRISCCVDPDSNIKLRKIGPDGKEQQGRIPNVAVVEGGNVGALNLARQMYVESYSKVLD
ncbi:MAG: hypothetical protein OEL89_02850 [Candidatus Peregrinibacteria bacterium]|nr:hypothetical protein [Candidatus Peregrinibacteria bacterium]